MSLTVRASTLTPTAANQPAVTGLRSTTAFALDKDNNVYVLADDQVTKRPPVYRCEPLRGDLTNFTGYLLRISQTFSDRGDR